MTSSPSTYGIITTDQDLIVKSWNVWLENACGLSAKQFIGKKLTEAIPDLESRGLLARFHKTLNEGTVEVLSSVFHKYLIKCELQTISGGTVLMKQHVTIGPLKTEHRIVGLIITIEDASGLSVPIDTDELADENILQLGHTDWRVRKEAGLKLSQHTDQSMLASLLKMIREEHQDIAILNSILLVMSQSESDVVGALLSLLEDDDPDLKIYVIQTLGDRNDPRSIPTLLQCLNDVDSNVRYHAIEALGKLEAHEASDQLCEIALSSDFFVTFPAIDALTKLGDSSVIPRIIGLIDDPIFNEAILGLLGKLGDADIVELLTEKMNQEGASVGSISKALTEIIARYELKYREGELIKDVVNNYIKPSGIQNLITAAEIPEADEIQNIIKVLGWIRSGEAQQALTKMLGNPSIQKEVIEAFVNFGNKVTDLLIGQLNASEDDIRIAAAIALGRIGDPRSGAPLIKMIGENDELTVFVIGSLAKLGIREAFEPLLEQLGASNPSVRRASIAALNSIGHPEMPVRIEKLIQSEDPLFRESAIQIAGYFGYPGCKKLVQQCIEDADIRVVCAAIENLPFFDDKSTNELLTNLYSNGSTRIRASVVKAANHLDDVNNFKTLSESLNDSDAWVRYYAIRTICNHLLQDHLPRLIVLAEKDKAIHVRLAAIEAIGQLNGTEALPVFAKLLTESNNDIILTTIYALGMLQSDRALQMLMRLFNENELQRRSAVIKAISHFNSSEVTEKLHWICATEVNAVLTDSAIEGLSTIKTVQAVDSLIKLSVIPKIKEKCIAALVMQKNLALKYLIETFNERPLQVKRNCIEALSRTKKNEASEALIHLLDHPLSQIRIDAMNALYRIGNVNIRDRVEKMSVHDPDVFVRHNAKEILKKS